MENIETGRENGHAQSDYPRDEQNDAVLALHKAQKRLELICRNTSVSTWDYHVKTRRIIHSGKSIQMHGFDQVIDDVPDYLVNCGYVHPDSSKAFCEMYERLFAGDEYVEGIFRVQTADRSGYWYEHVRYTMIFDENGHPDIAVGVSTDVSHEMELKKKADTDSLTGILNHGAFMQLGGEALLHPREAFLLLIDLDYFKNINDTFGHIAGDNSLARFGKLLSHIMEKEGCDALCGRMGGDEFAILIHGIDRAGAESLAKLIIDNAAVPDADGVSLTVSIGIAEYPKDADSLIDLYLSADKALYSVKHNHMFHYCFFDERQKEQRVNARRQFLADTVHGGMMGGYMEEGFPFYFIDERMLHTLGYATEDEFVRDNGGFIDGCMHPDDRAQVGREVYRQLAGGNRYTVEYRMRKKDGSYIWVHDIGEKITAPDGRAAIMSVCYDISTERERGNLLNNLLDGLEARVALYRVEQNATLKLIRASDDITRIAHYSDEEYKRIYDNKDAMDSVYPPDQKFIREAIAKSIKEDIVVTEHFRLLDKDGGFTWVTGMISRLGSDCGRPLVRIIFMPLSIQNELQLQMLDSEYIGVYVIDEKTDELYYANEASLKMHGVVKTDIAGKTCHEVFYENGAPCAHCWRNPANAGDGIVHINKDRVLSIQVQKRIWNNRDIAIIYSRDVTKEHKLQKQRQELLDNIPAGLSLFSVKDGKIIPLFFSSAIGKQLGLDTDRLLQIKDSDAFFHCVHPDDLPRLFNQLTDDAGLGKRGCYYRYRCWNAVRKEYMWIELQANFLKNGDETLVYATYNDLTAASRMQEQLEEKRQELEAVMRYGKIGMWIYDLDTRYIDMQY
ncbi:MAG: PAS domain-containing protein, partial [Clostridia bacterium]|nr:PAS domain-containing protein [Clostridia bacterium]